MSLTSEIEIHSKTIRTDSYQMSIGELANLYRDGELDVHPEFQRIYRWSESQKTRLIESLLLGIPLPPIFVSQRNDGVWDVVDGVQRLSTIFQFMGILKNENGDPIPPLTLTESKYLPSLNGKLWSSKKDQKNAFTITEQLFIKRAKLDINIVLKESNDEAKFELFMRINTGGTPLTSQEVRNCLLVMKDRNVYAWLRDLAENQDFKESIAITDRATEEQYHIELATRFLLFRTIEEHALKSIHDIGDYLNDNVDNLIRIYNKYRKREQEAFQATFTIINEHLASDAFRKFNHQSQRYTGGFLVSAFEMLAIGIGYHYDKSTMVATASLKALSQDMWNLSDFTESSGSGIRGNTRIQKVIPLGRKHFSCT